jgi:GT2 family glycosyltransferase
MDVSVIIVNYNVRYFLEQCILSLQAASQKIAAEIIVVDNNSTDESCALLKEKYPEVILVENNENVGFSKANNQGVAIAKGKYVLILNPDTLVSEEALENLLKFAKSKQNLGILCAKQMDGTGKFAPESKRGIPTPQASFYKLFGISGKHSGKYYATHLTEDESGVIDVASGAFMFLKKSIYKEVNGFDEDYFMYGEDIDLSYKILHKGYQNYYYPKVKIIHYKGESTRKDSVYLKYFHEAMEIFYKKHFKLNKVYDFFMSFGIEFWYLLKYFKFKQFKEKIHLSKNVLYLGANETVINYLNNKYFLVKNETIEINQLKKLIEMNKIDTLIFDNETYSNKQIIEVISLLKNKNVAFKIHPKNTNYIIGSTRSDSRGQVEIITAS